MPKRFVTLAWIAAACVYVLIVLGFVVRITGSGLGCGNHWPLCNGRLFPPPERSGGRDRMEPPAGGGHRLNPHRRLSRARLASIRHAGRPAGDTDRAWRGDREDGAPTADGDSAPCDRNGATGRADCG